MKEEYYLRFQKAVARSHKWQLCAHKNEYFYVDFLKDQKNVFLDPLMESLHVLERRLIEFFSINMIAARRGLAVEDCIYDELRNEARLLSLSDVFQEMQQYPLTVTTMLYYLFQDKNVPTPALITVGNAYLKGSAPYWTSARLKEFHKMDPAKRTDKITSWLTFVDGTILTPTLKLIHPEIESKSLLYLTTLDSGLTANAYIFEPILIGEHGLMQFFGHC
ncbi:hypothetical protein PVA45_00035 [Entomospira entomophila]|uniref:Uncharacterized protein n=1 Tax=Entomospira entomophila TaxID=2719988 RepID=A0A968G788_9SPIO|nr:hypothetical protein [Entomospira entomophilus]NIZ39912.1 hypothetical protein [Entomospira entomophilus]WDI35474.1 hypothetical protein PVA45_00035 [Entomospira entomophilus]